MTISDSTTVQELSRELVTLGVSGLDIRWNGKRWAVTAEGDDAPIAAATGSTLGYAVAAVVREVRRVLAENVRLRGEARAG